MDEISDAFERFERSDVRYRIVIDMASPVPPQEASARAFRIVAASSHMAPPVLAMQPFKPLRRCLAGVSARLRAAAASRPVPIW
ncbi:hypothetical protein AB4084_39370, partial [Lysobacter sp. 2RAB21]